jgi:hypothetical protein
LATKLQLTSSVVVSEYDGTLSLNPTTPKHSKIRLMRKDPTIFLARLMLRAAIISAAWSTEADLTVDIAVKDYIDAEAQRLKADYLEDCTRGVIDFGWQPFEKISAIKDGMYHVSSLKPLLQDITEIIVDDDGNFNGFLNDETIVVGAFDSILVNVDAECGYHYGTSYMGNVEDAYDKSNRISSVADVYDKKIAGAHWIIYFPDGKSMFNGVETANDVIARTLISKLENSGSMAIPYKTTEILDDLSSQSKSQWIIDLKEASGSGANFDARLQRCDKEKVRGFGIPERSILEGQFGTKAEATAHGDFALTGIELLHSRFVTAFNKQIVNQLLRMNYGDELVDKVYVKAQPLNDGSLLFLRDIYKSVLGNADGFMQEMATLDVDALKDKLGIPYSEPIINDITGLT